MKNHAAVEPAVDAISFIAKNRASKEALKSANLLKSLEINALITGEEGTGKTTLAKYIVNAPIINGDSDITTITTMMIQHQNVIIRNFDKIKYTDTLFGILQKNKTRIIATSQKNIFSKIRDKFFSLSINLPPLVDRREDIYPLAKKFLEDAKYDFGFRDIDIDIKEMELNLDRNCYSLKMSIYKALIEELMQEKDIMRILQNYFLKKLGSKNDYRDNLHIYEIPLIKAGLLKFKSQLKIADQFGINRNTLRKKINEYNL